MATHEGTGLLAHGGGAEGGAAEEGHDGPQKNFPPCFPLSANAIATSLECGAHSARSLPRHRLRHRYRDSADHMPPRLVAVVWCVAPAGTFRS